MIVIFPGQGVQKSGMGQNFLHLENVKKYIKIASDITNIDVEKLLTTIQDEELSKTENSQIAIFTLTYSLMQEWLAKNGKDKIKMLAGHSLGQYTALAVAGVLTFENTCMLIQARSQAMAKVNGKMLALLGADFVLANTIASMASKIDARETQCCFVANHNSSSQIVLSGSANAIERAVELIGNFGKKAIVLPTSGPFHSPYMHNACNEILSVIEKLEFNDAQIPVISNVIAKEQTDANLWKSEVAIHMKCPVRWYESLEYAKNNGCHEFVEVGPSAYLTNMAKRDGYNIRYEEVK